MTADSPVRTRMVPGTAITDALASTLPSAQAIARAMRALGSKVRSFEFPPQAD
jgi:hypothetical protein